MTIGTLSYPTIQPTLTLDFAKAKQLDPRVTFSRSSSGTYFDDAGVLRSVGTNQARFDHDPTTGESLGLLVEEARTNNATYSELFTGTGITPNATVSPANNFSGSLFVPQSSGYYVELPVTISAVSAARVYSVYAKNAGRNYVNIGYRLSGGINKGNIQFDLTTGEQTVSSSIFTGGSEYVGNGWWRVWAYTSDVTSTNFVIGAADQNDIYTTADGQGIYLWGAQLEAGSFPTSYIPTPATFTSRSTTATYYDASGVIQTAGIDVARDDAYFPDENGVMRPAGLLLEAAGTNLLTYSEQLDNAAWSHGSSLTVSANAGAAPDGTTTADLIYANTSGNAVTIFQNLGASSGTFTNTVFAKASGKSWLILWGAQGNLKAYFNVSTGVVGTVDAGITASIVLLSNGWCRCSVTQTATFRYLFVAPADSDNSTAVTASGTDGILVWGAQLEASPYPTSYIPTTTTATVTRAADVSSSSTVTRSADVAQITGSNFSSWYNQSEGTLFASVRTVTPASVTNGLLQLTDGTSNNRIELGQGGSGDSYPRVQGLYRYLNSTTGSFLNQETGWNTDGKTLDNWAFAFNSSGFTFETKYDSTSSTGTGTYPQNLTQFSLGHRGTISRLTYYPVRLPDATLQTITS